MKKTSIFILLTLLAAFAPRTWAQEQPITIPNFGSWTENFALADWPYSNTQNGNYNLFCEYPEKCWLVPYTIVAGDEVGTPSPRLWYNGEGNNRHISMKEGSVATAQNQIVALPVFSNPLNMLSIPGIKYNNVPLARNGDQVSLTLSGSTTGYYADHGTLTGSSNPYTLAMEAFNTLIIRDSDCPQATNLVATHVMPTSATLGWEGEAESYHVRYRTLGDEQASFFENFENLVNDLLPSGWTAIDADGDGHNWYGHVNTGTEDYVTYSGNGIVASDSYTFEDGALSPDNWLITPQLELGGRMSVWLRGQADIYAEEHFAIYLSLTGKAVSDFTIELVPESVATGEYVEYAADLSAYEGQQGYIAIRHFNVSDMFILNVDDFGIYLDQ